MSDTNAYYAEPARIQAGVRQIDQISTLAEDMLRDFVSAVNLTSDWPGTNDSYAKQAIPQEKQEREAAVGTMAALPRVMRLVWEASPGLTIGLALATILAGFIPAATAYAAKLLINAVLAGIRVRADHLPDQGVLPLPFHTIQSPGLTTTGWLLKKLMISGFAPHSTTMSI